ncbi:hypothetical protein WN51_13698 [Melipona quadrifasciata]|uniref:Uncharacterized protein n=1 Tax=Melipona quadrifasciata TaxID=166423 RepID=A0A0N0U503_9HYME|nr:hypothetical protein WN51_13698 [Melipona quadrifasciata]
MLEQLLLTFSRRGTIQPPRFPDQYHEFSFLTPLIGGSLAESLQGHYRRERCSDRVAFWSILVSTVRESDTQILITDSPWPMEKRVYNIYANHIIDKYDNSAKTSFPRIVRSYTTKRGLNVMCNCVLARREGHKIIIIIMCPYTIVLVRPNRIYATIITNNSCLRHQLQRLLNNIRL